MEYHNVRPAVFLERPNRFIARCLTDGGEVTAHVKNTGRCKELLVPGAPVWLCYSGNAARKTPCDLIVVDKQGVLFNIDSQAPNRVAEEALLSGALCLPGLKGPYTVLRERSFGASRIDLLVQAGEKQCFVEVKGVTQEQDGTALFPDAPTERGFKHLGELARAVKAGYGAAVLFVLQFAGARQFTPNREIHPAFADALRAAQAAGVQVLAAECAVAPDSLRLSKPVKTVF